MNWSDEGFLISKNRYNENSLIAELFTKDIGKISGIIFGGTSKKIKNYLQVGNKLHVNYNSKNENKIGYFKTELIKPISPLYFNDKERTSALISICSLLNILLPDSQPNKKIYESFEKLINSINLKSKIFLMSFQQNIKKIAKFMHICNIYVANSHSKVLKS